MRKSNIHRKQELEYSTVEFILSNPTNTDINVDVFDSNVAADVPSVGIGYPDTLGQQIFVGSNYDGICYDNTRNNIITGEKQGAVSGGNLRIIDTETGAIIISVSTTIKSIKMIYVESNDSIYSIGDTTVGTGHFISVINPSTGAEIILLTCPFAGANISDVVYSPTSDKVYFKDSSADQRIWVLDASTNLWLGSINMNVGTGSRRMTYSSSNNSVYVFDSAIGTIMQVDCSTDTIVDTIIVGGRATIGIFNSANNQIYFRNTTAGTISILDVSNNTISATTILGIGNFSTDMAYSPLTNHIWLVDDTNNDIPIIDCSNNTVVNNLAIPATWDGNIIYCQNINTVFTTPSTVDAATQYIQQIDATGSVYNVSGTADYNSFVRDSQVNPKKLDRLMIYAQANSNLENPLGLNTEDANGNSCGDVKFPTNTVSVNQFQGAIAQVDFEDFMIDVNTSINYTIPAQTTIKWVLFYKEYKRKDLLSGKVMISDFDVHKPDNAETYDDKYLIDTQQLPNWEGNIEVSKMLNYKN